MHLNIVKSLAIALIAGAALAAPAKAAVTIDIAQDGANVVASGSGTIDLTGLIYAGSESHQVAGVIPLFGIVGVGGGADADLYGGVSGPGGFGSGWVAVADSATGSSYFGIGGVFGEVAVTAGYVSGSLLSGSATFDNRTIAGLGLTSGTYTYTWGAGAHADSLTVVVAPEPSTWAMMALGFAGLALTGYRASRKPAAA